jgi:hypothetical protein
VLLFSGKETAAGFNCVSLNRTLSNGETNTLVVTCFPTTLAGQPLSPFPPGETDGASATRVKDYSHWPQQFRGTANGAVLQFTVLLLVDDGCVETAIGTEPIVGALSSTPQVALAVQEQMAAAAAAGTSFSPEALGVLVQPMGINTFDRLYFLNFNAQRTDRLNGSSDLEYHYTSLGAAPLRRQAVENTVDVLLSSLSIQQAADVRAFRAQPNITAHALRYQIMYVEPRPTVQVVKEVQSYTLSNFVSDVGGFLNLLAVGLLFLFPVRFAPTTERVFLAHWLLLKWNNRHTLPNDSARDRQPASEPDAQHMTALKHSLLDHQHDGARSERS